MASDCSALRFPREADDGLVERGGSFLAVSAPHLTIDQIDGKLGIVGQPSHQLLQSRGGLALVAQLIVERGHPAPELDVARRRRQRGACGHERAIQIAQGVAHAPQHVPFDGAGRAFQLARQLGERPAAARHRERDRPYSAPALGVARWKLAKQRGERPRPRGRRRPGSPPAMPQARRAQRELQLGGGVPRAQPRLQHLGRRDGLAGAFQRVCEALGDLVACRLGARQLAQQRDAFLLRALSGASPERARIASAASMRRRRPAGWLSSFKRVVVAAQRGGVVAGGRQRARTAGDRGHGLRRDPQSLVEGGGGRLRVTERRQQVGVRRERRVRGAIAARSPRARRERETARAAAPDRRARRA